MKGTLRKRERELRVGRGLESVGVFVPFELRGRGHRQPGAACLASNGQKEILHLWSEFTSLRYLLRETHNPVCERKDVTAARHFVEEMILVRIIGALVHMKKCHGQTDKCVKAKARCDLQLPVTPADR